MGVILLSFDVEEFDMAMEYGGHLTMDQQLEITTDGLHQLLRLLEPFGIRCTFYCTAQYALNRADLVRRLHSEGFEIASHGYYHSSFDNKDLSASKAVLENIIGATVLGYRMARMMPLDAREVEKAGYLYNSSVNPTWIPGRYNNLSQPRTLFRAGKLFQLPASVTPFLRIPLFWLSFHNFSLPLYLRLLQRVLQQDGYANIYFHPWELIDYSEMGGAKYPGYVTRNSGAAMEKRLVNLFRWALKKEHVFQTTAAWLREQKL
ncbi:MAG TPA: polysaccharide deacetylase family protein [Flavisolibacter sp.]